MTRSNRNALVVGLTLWTISLPAFAGDTPLSCAQVMHKLSMTLLERPATRDLITRCEQQTAGAPRQVLEVVRTVAVEHFRQPAFRTTAEHFFGQWFGLPWGETTAFAGHLAFRDGPLSELLDKDYVYLDGRSKAHYQNLAIRADTPLPQQTGVYRTVYLREDEDRFRTFLSHPDLLNFYPDTATNLNRKRANYVLATLLCETLAPTPVPEDREPDPAPDDPHASDANCIGCHYRLDPLARYFDRWRPPLDGNNKVVFDSTRAAQGELQVIDGDQRREYTGVGLRELSTAILSDPRFPACTVEKAWSFVFGATVPLGDSDRRRYVDILGQSDSLQTLLSALVEHPLFWTDRQPRGQLFSDIRPGLAACTTCHASDQGPQPRFSPQEYPYRLDAEQNAQLLKRVFNAVRGLSETPMPPPPVPSLSEEQLRKMRSWIENGAPVSDGQATLSSEQIADILSN